MLLLLLRMHDIVIILTGSTLGLTSELADDAPH
jgi:hypothetical protein